MNRIELIHGNIADFSFGHKFDLIIAPYHVFQAVTDNRDVESTLICSRNHLSDDGIFIINVFKPKKIMDESWCGEESLDFEVHDEINNINIIRRSCNEHIDPINQIIFRYLAYEVTYTDGRTERIVDHLEQKYYYRCQLRTIIEKTGLKIIEEYSWYDKQPYNVEGQEIIFICKTNAQS